MGKRWQTHTTHTPVERPAYWPPDALADIEFSGLPSEFRDAFAHIQHPEVIDWLFIRNSLAMAGLVKSEQTPEVTREVAVDA